MKKIYAINGSPRKNGNTIKLLEEALKGAKDSDNNIETEIIHLYDLNYTGCKSCFECKRIGGANYGKCPIKDDLLPVLEKLSNADAIIFGSPIYFGNITGQMIAFLERLLFQYLVYDGKGTKIAPKKMPTACIYTMNFKKEIMQNVNYPNSFSGYEKTIGATFFEPKTLIANNTYQFSDYSKYESSGFSEEEKRAHKETQFPIDLKNAYDIGYNLIK